MKHQVIVREEAAEEILTSFIWYEKRKDGLGEKFLVELDEVYNSILSNPLTFPVFHKNFRRALMSKFPFAIFFRVKEERVLIYSVFHTHRNPGETPIDY